MAPVCIHATLYTCTNFPRKLLTILWGYYPNITGLLHLPGCVLAWWYRRRKWQPGGDWSRANSANSASSSELCASTSAETRKQKTTKKIEFNKYIPDLHEPSFTYLDSVVTDNHFNMQCNNYFTCTSPWCNTLKAMAVFSVGPFSMAPMQFLWRGNKMDLCSHKLRPKLITPTPYTLIFAWGEPCKCNSFAWLVATSIDQTDYSHKHTKSHVYAANERHISNLLLWMAPIRCEVWHSSVDSWAFVGRSW